jgi:hypothetical protein
MKIYRLATCLLFLIIVFISEIKSQNTDSISFAINTRFSFYSFEKEGEFLLHVPGNLIQKKLLVKIVSGENTIVSWEGRVTGKLMRFNFPINLITGVYKVNASITSPDYPRYNYRASADLIILSYKTNEVKADRLTGGLIVNKRQFFPFGFYCYSPVFPTLPEEEIVKGFNMVSPYQKIIPETLNERKAYMDRCAQLGMKVHYNLLSVSGGGGVGSKIEGVTDQEKRKRLIAEIMTFRDHPALLGWYISDEPTGNHITPEALEEIYKVVRENDPWHPVSIVFMAPFLSSRKYLNALDIVMADPYPLPDLPVTMVGEIARNLKEEFNGKRPVWIVPQAFGGGELWSREPTSNEIRSMTWQSIINGATGIQYFVRQGPNYFPKSAALWGECGRMSVEVAELTPWLLSDEVTLPVESYSPNIIVSSKVHNGQLIVIAANKKNEPSGATIRVKGIGTGKALVLFENRSVSINGGVITDQLAPYGTQVYLINIRPEIKGSASSNVNLIKDPGFEDLSSPGIPSACYARPGGDRGATYFLDPREHFEGNHSLRITTPEKDKSVTIRFFPFQAKAGSTYSISILAKSDPEQRVFMLPSKDNDRLNNTKQTPQYVEILLGDFGRARFVPEKEWKRYMTFVTIPSDTLAVFKINLILKMPGQGTAWFDNIKVFEEKR